MRPVSRLKRIVRIVSKPGLSVRTKRDLLVLERSVGGAEFDVEERRVVVGRCVAIVRSRNDYLTIFNKLVDEDFRGDYDGKVVVDVGAHRGYLAVYAFSKGACGVVSYEPEEENLLVLRRSRQLSPLVEDAWEVRPVGVAAAAGTLRLFVSERSRSHSFLPGAKTDIVAERSVPVVPLEDALVEARTQSPGAPIVVKLNVEGMAGEIILGTGVDIWSGVDEVLFDWERSTPQSLDAVSAHLNEAGLSSVSSGRKHRYRRSVPGSR